MESLSEQDTTDPSTQASPSPPPLLPPPPPPPSDLTATESGLQQTASALFAAIDATHANAAAARDGVDAAAQDAMGAGCDTEAVTNSADALLCAIDAAEARKVVALEGEAVVVDAALELVMRAGEEGAWDGLSVEDALRVRELVAAPLSGPHEPPAIRFVASAPPSAGLGRVIAPAAVGPGGVSVSLSTAVWRGAPSALATVALADDLTASMPPEELAEALEALAAQLRAEARMCPAASGADDSAVIVTFVASVGARAVEARVTLPDAAAEPAAGGAFVALERLALGDHVLVPGPASGGGVSRARVCVDLRAPQTLRGAAAGLPPGEFLACTSLAGLLFIGAAYAESGGVGVRGGATLVRAYAADGSPAFSLSPAALGLPPLLRALAFDDATGLLLLALGLAGGGGGGDAAAEVLAAVDAEAATVRWVSPAEATISSVAVIASDATVLAVEGGNLAARLIADGSRVPLQDHQRYLQGLTGARLAVDESRACVHALFARDFAHRRWKRVAGGRLVNVSAAQMGRRGPIGRILPPTAPFAVMPPPARRTLEAGDSASPAPPLFLALPDPSDVSGTLLEVLSLPSFALVSRHDLPAPVIGLAAASSGTALIVADAAGDVRVLRWPLSGGLASSSSLAQSAVEAALSRRRAAAAAAEAAAALAAALPAPVEAPGPAQDAVGDAESAEAAAAGAAGGPLAPAAPAGLGPGPWPSAEAKYAHLPQHARFAAVEDADYTVSGEDHCQRPGRLGASTSPAEDPPSYF